MKRSLSSPVSSFVRAPLSQASVRGAEQACTAIATLACAHRLFPRSTAELTLAEWMELCIRQGGALYTCWGQNRYALASEMVDLVTPALPIVLGDEHGGQLWTDTNNDEENKSLSQAIHLLDHGACAVLTVGAFSVALFLAPPGGGGVCELFDSHSVEQGHGALYRFDSREDFIGYLQECFPNPTVPYAVSVIRPRFHHAPKTFPLKQQALDHANRLPFGFFYVFAHDTNKSGAKEFMVAGLDDFYEYYANLDPSLRCHYDMARTGCPVTFYMDLEYEIYPENADCDGRQMLTDLHVLVQPDVTAPFRVTDSSSRLVLQAEDNASVVPMFIGDDNRPGKVSYHSHNRSLWFRGTAEHGAYMKGVQQRANGELRVWRMKRGAMVEEFFADQSVYASDRCIRFVYSSKKGQDRFFVPLDTDPDNHAMVVVDPVFFFGCILSPPAPMLYILLEQQVQQQQKMVRAPSSSSSSSSVHPLNVASPVIGLLAAAVLARYKPQQMRGFEIHPNGIVMFPMVKHDCEICKHVHSSNNMYVLADLKTRVFYSKCHSDRSKDGPKVPFPASLGPLSMAIPEEMQDGSIFPAASLTAKMVLVFAGAVFSSARSTPKLPAPGSVPVFYNKANQEYEVQLQDSVCPKDSGHLVLVVTHTKLIIRCTSKKCKGKGTRWPRPSSGEWHLSFLFPKVTDLVVAFSPETFLAEANFYRALNISDDHAPFYICLAKLKEIEEWAALKQKSHGSTLNQEALAVQNKVRIIQCILGKEMMRTCYGECLALAPDFVYPISLLPSGTSTLAVAFLMYRTQQDGYKRCEEMFYVPHVDEAGRSYYRTVALNDLLTSIFTFERSPNLFSEIMLKGRACDDLKRVLKDSNHFPSLPMSKRYLAYANAVYDLVDNVALSWDEVRADPSIMPFNFLDQHFPVDMLERAKATCPDIVVSDDDGAQFVGAETFEPATPLFDGPLHDQQFTLPTIMWLYALLGRMFHYVGKRDGDNWETLVFLMGAPGSFKSSIAAIVQMYVQASQIGILGTQVETQFPIDDMLGKLMGFMTECGGCTLERDLLKQMASGDSVRVNGKHKTAINVPNWLIPLFFAGNAFLNVIDTDGSLCRRVALFPFLYMLRNGMGVTDLAERIFRDEGPLLLIKWNTLYCRMRATIRQRIQDLLPKQVREATRQAVMAGDSFKSFFAQEIIVTGSNEDRIVWTDVLKAYKAWCKLTGRKAYMVDPTKVEEQAMFRSFGIRLSRTASPVSLLRARPRTADDPPFRNVLEVKQVQRDGEEEEDSEFE